MPEYRRGSLRIAARERGRNGYLYRVEWLIHDRDGQLVQEVGKQTEQIPQMHMDCRKIAILRALQLGDLLCSVPAFRAIRAAQPGAEISLVGLPWANEFVHRFSQYFDRFIEFPGFPGLPEREPEITQIPGFLEQMQVERFDLAIQMQGSGRYTNTLVALFGAQRLAGFTLDGEYTPDKNLFIEYPSKTPEVLRHIRLTEHLGFASKGAALEFPLDADDLARGQAILTRFGLMPSGYICIHPGSRSADRRWPIERFAWVADRLAERGFSILLTGTEDESALTQTVAQMMTFPSFDLAGKTDLGTLAAIVNWSNLLVSNDTGISHLADALKRPSVVLFTGSDPDRWAPLDQVTHRIIRKANLVDPQTVLDEAFSLLQKVSSYAA